MKVFSLSLLSVTSASPAQAALLGTAQDLSSFSFYQRGSVGEFMGFFTKVSCQSGSRGSSADIIDRCRAYTCQPTIISRREQLQGARLPDRWSEWRTRSCWSAGLSAILDKAYLSAVMITDLEYPYRPAFSLLTKILDEHAALANNLPGAAGGSLGGAASAFSVNPSQAAAGGLPPAQKGKLEATLTQYLTKYQDPKQADTIMKVQKELDETKIVLVCISRRYTGSRLTL